MQRNEILKRVFRVHKVEKTEFDHVYRRANPTNTVKQNIKQTLTKEDPLPNKDLQDPQAELFYCDCP
jgi:hypothetical protein